MSEEFKAIIDLIQGAGEGTLWMFFGYLVFEIIKVASVFIGAIICIRTVLGKAVSLAHNSNTARVKQLCDMLGFVHHNYEGNAIYQEDKMLDAVRKHKDIIKK